ncbi:hypothetical protein PS15p_210901 [Mucor circinelloides]
MVIIKKLFFFRSECHSKIIKSLKEIGLLKEEEPNIKLDFIFCNTSIAGVNDVLVCEDKSTDAESTKDLAKTRKIREKTLNYWKAILPYGHALEHLSPISCRFNKLKLVITMTRIVDGITIYTTLKKISIPMSESSGGAIADYISIVISLMRHVVKNIETIETIIQTIHQDNLVFLSSNDLDLFDSDSDSCTS